eukprot:CAMPEP_0198260094 /NCGR_PEP_ID=MMETSP1447-20131203/9138_1 /TAXON_ID=420782 /ORGANISM="Chaetoceros dichaeta, Strain CCMP1751" /LENGTH=222 /DNA_ID=CAMNT_0043947663 /DNA_START=26 /DNA_END=691 /DNA_ORIENTATION=-
MNIPQLKRQHSYARHLCSLGNSKSGCAKAASPTEDKDDTIQDVTSAASLNTRNNAGCETSRTCQTCHGNLHHSINIETRETTKDRSTQQHKHTRATSEVPTFIVFSTKGDNDSTSGSDASHDANWPIVSECWNSNDGIPERKASFCTSDTASCTLSMHTHETRTVQTDTGCHQNATNDSCASDLSVHAAPSPNSDNFDNTSVSTLGKEPIHDIPRRIFSEYW